MSEAVRYQLRFIRMGEGARKGSFEICDRAVWLKWQRYYIDQRVRAAMDPDLTLGQRKEIVEACEAFEWRHDRPRLIREPIDNRPDNPTQQRVERLTKGS